MANTDLPPVPYKTPPVGQDGMLTQPWMAWFRQLFTRVGQNFAPSNDQILANPMTTVGDSLYGGASGAVTRLAGNTTTTKKFITQTGNGSASAAPLWDTIAASDIPTLNQNTTGTAANVTGTVAIANGGTGQTTQQAAMDALAGTQAAGKYLRSDGTHTALATIQAGDVPTLNQNTTGTSSNVTGTVGIANGGSGQTTQQAAIDALTGTQSSGKYLRSDGTHATLSSIVAGDVPTLNQNTTGTAANVTGTVAVANGGTGAATLAANNVILGNGTSAVQLVAPGTSGNFLKSNGTTWQSAALSTSYIAPTVQKFTTGSGTYTTPTSPAPLYIRVEMVGGGGGGGCSGNGGGTGTAGGASTFGTTLLSAGGGGGGSNGGAGSSGGGAGSSSLGTGPIGRALPGGVGAAGGQSSVAGVAMPGGSGAASHYGGQAAGGAPGGSGGGTAGTNTGGGGGGATGGAAINSGGGGGSGGFVEAFITSSIAATYAYAVGAGGAGGNASGNAGGAGAAGIIVVTEFYQ